MGYLFIILPLAILGGFAIWLKTKRKKYVVIYSMIILLLFFLIPCVLFLMALANGEAIFPKN